MNKEFVRMAGHIRRRLVGNSDDPDHGLAVHALNLLSAQRAAESGWRRLEKARRRSWHAAAGQVRQELFRLARQVQGAAYTLGHHEHATQHGNQAHPPPSLRTIYDELRQLHDELDDVVFQFADASPRVVARIPPIVLEGLNLGPFAVELHVCRLEGRSADSSCFDARALEPNAAGGDRDITHPHVSGRSLCAGEAAVPIAQALRQGRIFDAFVLVRSVLQTYNASSPYVAIEDWEGVHCSDCGDGVRGEDLHACEVCDDRFCNHCIASCDACDRSSCRGCLDRDPLTRRRCCPNCRSTCPSCGRVVEDQGVDHDTGLCPECESKRAEASPTPTSNQKEDDHDERQADHQPASADHVTAAVIDASPDRVVTAAGGTVLG